ncbi:MAG TPA: arginine deiminase family protein [Vicinamibacterales bacterium]|nr:arginine deiminase family protein [Vicinamibacterales bacterium]
MATNTLAETGRLARVLVKHPREAFVSDETCAAQWKPLNFSAAPALARAAAEYEAFLHILQGAGAQVEFLPADERTNLDSIYARDASIVCARGVILGRMGKRLRAAEPSAQKVAFRGLGVPIAGEITEPGCLEGGDVVWLDDRTIAVGHGYRTNEDGILQLRAILADSIDEMIVVPLPHWRGPGDVLHLMSLISPVDSDLAVVYSPLLPVPFRQELLERGYALVEVPETEFDTMGTNVLALGPRDCVMLAGNRRTRGALEHAGARVTEYAGDEISVKGAGGPTCLTRPLARAPARRD